MSDQIRLLLAKNSENHDELYVVGVSPHDGGIWTGPQSVWEASEDPCPEVADRAWPTDQPAACKPGLYKHFKGGIYRALFLARNIEDPDTSRVIYVSLAHGTIWARPLKMWLEYVLWPESGHRQPRFLRCV